MSRQSGRSNDHRKVSGELLTLTYGALVAQLVKDNDSDEEVNKQLDKMGYNIGIRLIEDFLARSSIGKCKDLRETAEIISKNGFKMFLNITPIVANWNQAGDEFSLIIDNNPLTEFAELPEEHKSLSYCNILCGVIRGALEMVQLEVETKIVQDQLKGDHVTELRIKYIRKIEEAAPAGDD